MFENIFNPSSFIFWLILLVILAAVSTFIARSFRTYVKFIYPNAKYEAIGNPFIQEKELNILVENTNLEAFKDRLNVLRDYQVEGETASVIQKSLDQNFVRTITMMRKDSSKELHAFYDLYLQKNDLYFIKNEIKNIIRGNKKRQSLETINLAQTRQFIEQLQNTSKENISQLLGSFGFKRELIEEITKETPDLFQLDILFEKHFLTQFKELKVPSKCERVKQDYIKNMIDLFTIKYLLRAKHLSYSSEKCKTIFLGEGKQISRWRFDEMTDCSDVTELINSLEGTTYYSALSTKIEQYIKDKSIQVFENGIHSVFLLRIKEISLQNYVTLGPTLRFLISKEFEIKNLKAIVKGIAENLSLEIIKNNLVKEVEG